MTRARRLLLSFFAAAATFAAPPEHAPKPKLVLAIVIDQFRYDYLLRFRGSYHAGLDRLEAGARWVGRETEAEVRHLEDDLR